MTLHTLTGFQLFPFFASDAGVTGRSSLHEPGGDEIIPIPGLGLPPRAIKSTSSVEERTYWGAVTGKLWRDKITVAAIFLLIFMIAITLGASWIANNLLGFDPI